MADFINNIKYNFRRKDLLVQLIIINVAIFIALTGFKVITTLFKLDSLNLLEYIAVSSDTSILVTHPWTAFSYMFVHLSVFHLLFNMLILFGFGRIFLSYFSPKNLGSLYILGGLAGALLYVVTFNTIPFYMDMGHPFMIGASASVTAIIFASAFYNPNMEINLLLLGRIKILYVALFIFVLDFISLGDTSNPGGHVAHIGGAIIGYFFAKQYLKGKDITKWINKMMDWFVNLSKPTKKQKVKIKYKNRESDYEYNQRKNQNTEDIDRILDKIKASGYSSLNQDEKKRLFDASKK